MNEENNSKFKEPKETEIDKIQTDEGFYFLYILDYGHEGLVYKIAFEPDYSCEYGEIPHLISRDFRTVHDEWHNLTISELH